MRVEPALIHRLFYPQVPALFCAGHGGRVSAMPVVSYMSVSDAPPMVAVACFTGGQTLKLARAAGAFSLCLVDRGLARAVSFLASNSGSRYRNKISSAGLRSAKGRSLNVPVVAGASAVLECRVQSSTGAGDHVLVVGLVEECRASSAFAAYWDYRKYRPILYDGWRGGMKTYRDPTLRGVRRARRASPRRASTR